MMRRRISHQMSKWAIVTVALMLLLAVPNGCKRADAQIVIMEDDDYNSGRTKGYGPGYVPLTPQGWDDDWFPYAPMGDGLLLLAGLGCAYMARKRMKGKKND